MGISGLLCNGLQPGQLVRGLRAYFAREVGLIGDVDGRLLLPARIQRSTTVACVAAAFSRSRAIALASWYTAIA